MDKPNVQSTVEVTFSAQKLYWHPATKKIVKRYLNLPVSPADRPISVFGTDGLAKELHTGYFYLIVMADSTDYKTNLLPAMLMTQLEILPAGCRSNRVIQLGDKHLYAIDSEFTFKERIECKEEGQTEKMASGFLWINL